ncbi:MAG: FeoB-associated Cys-rich membrane protein [Campylobacterota bacterium]
MAENIFLLIILLGAGYYLYKKLFKSGGCNCSGGGCKK